MQKGNNVGCSRACGSALCAGPAALGTVLATAQVLELKKDWWVSQGLKASACGKGKKAFLVGSKGCTKMKSTLVMEAKNQNLGKHHCVLGVLFLFLG